MAQYVGQIQGKYSSRDNLIAIIKEKAAPSEVVKITKIGIQADEGELISINHIDFEIGKTEILEFEDVDIKHLQILSIKNGNVNIPIPIIIDYIYEDNE